jgi:hypothetical protein
MIETVKESSTETNVRRAGRFAVAGMAGVTLGIVLAIVLLIAAVTAFLGIRSLIRHSPSERAQKEATALFVTASGHQVASVQRCRQMSVDDPYRTFRCQIRTPHCSRSLLFIEEATYFGDHDLQLSDRPDRTLRHPCSVRGD